MMNNIKNPLVTIIIATFNSDKTLSRALDSIINQTFQDWECIIVDGLSKDKTIDIVSEYEKKDARFKHLSEKDKGIYDAFNKGWQLAKGEWIYYLGSDDYLTNDGFSNLFLELDREDYQYSIVSGHVYKVSKKGDIKVNYSSGFYGSHQAKLVRKEIIKELGGFDLKYKYLADLDLILRIKQQGMKIKNTDSIIAYFSYGGASQMLSHQLELAKERWKIYPLDKELGFYPMVVLKNTLVSIISIIKTIITNR